jgi:hypothetical protein
VIATSNTGCQQEILRVGAGKSLTLDILGPSLVLDLLLQVKPVEQLMP